LNRVSCLCPTGLNRDPPVYASFIVGMSYWGLTFCPGWPLTIILLISPSRVARITGVNHSAWKCLCVFITASMHLNFEEHSQEKAKGKCLYFKGS
jgi:hypothetical protein